MTISRSKKPGKLAFVRQDLVEHALDAGGAQPLQADDRSRVDGEGVGFEPVRPPELPELGGVHDREAEAELGLHLLTPLERERRRADDDDAPCPVPEQHLLHDQAGFDRLAEAHVVGDEQVDPRHGESAGDGFELVLLDRDTGPERGLKRPGVGAGDGAQRTALRKAPSCCGSSQLAAVTDGNWVAETISRPGSISQATVSSSPRSSSLTLVRVTRVRPGSLVAASSSCGWLLVLTAATTHC